VEPQAAAEIVEPSGNTDTAPADAAEPQTAAQDGELFDVLLPCPTSLGWQVGLLATSCPHMLACTNALAVSLRFVLNVLGLAKFVL
jgi:hypothetical protein